MKILCISFGPAISCAYAPGYIQTFISSTFVSCSVLTDFCQYLCLPLYRFLFEFFWSRNFWGSCYSSICVYRCEVTRTFHLLRQWTVGNKLVVVLGHCCALLSSHHPPVGRSPTTSVDLRTQSGHIIPISIPSQCMDKQEDGHDPPFIRRTESKKGES
jgi:hypothetical protein